MPKELKMGIIRRYWAENEEWQDGTTAREEIGNYLSNHSIPLAEIRDELLENPENLISNGVRVLISPSQRWFKEKYYINLIRYAEKGGIVLATYPSFWKNEFGKIVIRQRFIDLFGVDDVCDRNIEGKIKFQSSTEHWLFEGLPESVTTYEYGWVVINSTELSEGEWLISNAYGWKSDEKPSVLDENLTGRSSILCLIKKWPSGGMFIYTNFFLGLWLKKDPRIGRILDNISKKMTSPAISNPDEESQVIKLLLKQINTYKIIMAIMGIAIGLLVSRFFFSGTDFTDITKSIVTAILTGLVTFAVASIIGKPQKD